ncbi:hypothetical protein Hanom_Chr10g00887521 [Helianthus anomalus]
MSAVAAGLDGERQATTSGESGSGYVWLVRIHILFWFDSGNPRHLRFSSGVIRVRRDFRRQPTPIHLMSPR